MTDKPIGKKSETQNDALDNETLKASEEKYRRIVENVNTGILVAQDARLVYVNPGIANFLGYTEEALLSHPNPFEFIHPDDVETVFERHIGRLQGKNVPDVYS